ncbi:glycoside hydrolase family 30 protein [candidate division KSB1 bacterium]|nr:glycoside hydrolase family 30 protein [candidate division KSB1 bacterium]
MRYKIFALLFVFVTLYFSCVDQTKIQPFDLTNKNITVYVTAKDTDQRLAKTDGFEISEFPQPNERDAAIMIDTNKKFEEFVGIGGALTDASAETFYKLPAEKQQEIITAYFDAEKGIGYSFCRTHIHSCDFSSESYAYTETDGDTLLENFDIEHDRKFKLPFIKQAIAAAGPDFKLFASPWSPPAWMKTNNDMLHGGKLKPEYRGVWANYFIKFMDEYSKEGVPIWGLTVQNEPMAVQRWESCIFTAQEERDFVRDYLGPAVVNSSFPDIKIIIWDHNRGIMYQRAKVVYDDPEASKYVWGTGFHWYVNDSFDNVRLHREAFPDKHLVFTEGCVFPFNADSLDLWKWGERYGESILHDLNKGTVAWVDWNVLLDETGGPNHVYNLCYAPVIGDTKTGEITYMNSYYYLGHFSKFIRPGARRIISSSNKDELLTTAYINPDNSLAIVVLNLTGEDMPFKTWIEGKAFETKSQAHSILTIVVN